MLNELRGADFEPFIQQTFNIRLEESEPIGLELTCVTAAGTASESGARLPFSLQFLGPVSPKYLLQHIYRLEHAQMGALDLFIVPLGPERGRMRYEVVFA